MTDKDVAVAEYTKEIIRRSGYDSTIDDKVYQYRGLWVDKPDVESLVVGNLLLIEDFPSYVGSVWKKANLNAITPIGGSLCCGINYIPIETWDDDTEQNIFDFFYPYNALLYATYFKINLQGQKSTNTIGGTFKFYVQDTLNQNTTELGSFTMAASDVRLNKELILKFLPTETEGKDAATKLFISDELSTTPVPSPIDIFRPDNIKDSLHFFITFQSDTSGQVFTLTNSNAVMYGV